MTDNNKRIFGYVRVSSRDQNLDRQIESLKQYVPDERYILADKSSGKDFDRPAYKALKMMVRPGDIIYIHEMERLGRNKQEIKENLEYFKENGVCVRILNIPTTMMDFSGFESKLQKMLMEMVNNILIEVLATMAETERDNIRKRQREGIDIALKKGVRFGRPRKDLPSCWPEDKAKWQAGEVTAVSLMKKYGMCSSTFYNKVSAEKNNFFD